MSTIVVVTLTSRQAAGPEFLTISVFTALQALHFGPRAAGTGLTLTAATHVIHLFRWWNPAVEEQCNDRVHRIGQTRNVSVHVPLALHPDLGAHSFDCLLQTLLQRKRKLAEQALWPLGDTGPDSSELISQVAAPQRGDLPVTIADSMAQLFLRDGLPPIQPNERGAYALP